MLPYLAPSSRFDDYGLVVPCTHRIYWLPCIWVAIYVEAWSACGLDSPPCCDGTPGIRNQYPPLVWFVPIIGSWLVLSTADISILSSALLKSLPRWATLLVFAAHEGTIPRRLGWTCLLQLYCSAIMGDLPKSLSWAEHDIAYYATLGTCTTYNWKLSTARVIKGGTCCENGWFRSVVW